MLYSLPCGCRRSAWPLEPLGLSLGHNNNKKDNPQIISGVKSPKSHVKSGRNTFHSFLKGNLRYRFFTYFVNFVSFTHVENKSECATHICKCSSNTHDKHWGKTSVQNCLLACFSWWILFKFFLPQENQKVWSHSSSYIFAVGVIAN